MIEKDKDFLILTVDKDLLERLRVISGKGFPLIEKNLSELMNLEMSELLLRYAMGKKVTILAGKIEVKP